MAQKLVLGVATKSAGASKLMFNLTGSNDRVPDDGLAFSDLANFKTVFLNAVISTANSILILHFDIKSNF